MTKEEILNKNVPTMTFGKLIGTPKEQVFLAMEEYAQQFNQWTTVKPDLKEECVLVTANEWGGHWHYVTWIIQWVNHGNGPYMALLTGTGNEYGDLADLTADKYLILPKHGD